MLRFVIPFLFETPGGGSGGGAPAGGEGGGAAPEAGGGTGLYAEALAGVPEELRPFVEEQFKNWDGNVTPKLQEAAQLREKFEPYTQIDGFDQIDPERMQALVEFNNLLSGAETDPSAFIEWLQGANQAFGLQTIDPQSISQEQWQQFGQQQGWAQGDQGQQGDPRYEQLAQQVEFFRNWMQEAEQWRTETVTQQQVDAARQQFAARLDEITAEHPNLDPQLLVEHAHAFTSEDDPLGKAAERLLAQLGGAAGAQAQRDLEQPGGALSGGRASTAPDDFSGFDDPRLKDAARARLRA